MNQTAISDGSVRDTLQARHTVRLAEETGLAVIAALYQMKRMTWKDDSWQSGHAAIPFASNDYSHIISRACLQAFDTFQAPCPLIPRLKPDEEV